MGVQNYFMYLDRLTLILAADDCNKYYVYLLFGKLFWYSVHQVIVYSGLLLCLL